MRLHRYEVAVGIRLWSVIAEDEFIFSRHLFHRTALDSARQVRRLWLAEGAHDRFVEVRRTR